LALFVCLFVIYYILFIYLFIYLFTGPREDDIDLEFDALTSLHKAFNANPVVMELPVSILMLQYNKKTFYAPEILS